MLGQDFVGAEVAIRQQAAFDYHALTFAEQIGDNPFIGNADFMGQIGDDEVMGQPIRFLAPAFFFHDAAEAQPPVRLKVLLRGDIGRRVEEHDTVLERGQYQGRRSCQQQAAQKYDGEAAAFPGH